MSDGYIRHKVVISGDAALQHNGQAVDPLNKYAKAMREIHKDKARKGTEEGIVALGNVEYEASLYLDAKGRVIWPSRVLEACIAAGAKRTKEGKSALAAMFVDTDGVLEYEGGPLSVAKLIASEDHRLTVGVRIQQSRLMRVRPFFKNWTASFEVSVLGEQVNTSTLTTWIENAGSFCGLGDWRPRYGRFELSSISVIRGK